MSSTNPIKIKRAHNHIDNNNIINNKNASNKKSKSNNNKQVVKDDNHLISKDNDYLIDCKTCKIPFKYSTMHAILNDGWYCNTCFNPDEWTRDISDDEDSSSSDSSSSEDEKESTEAKEFKTKCMGIKNQDRIDIDNMMIKDLRVFTCTIDKSDETYMKQMKIFMEYVNNYKASNHLIQGIIKLLDSHSICHHTIGNEIIEFIGCLEVDHVTLFRYYLKQFIEIINNIKIQAVFAIQTTDRNLHENGRIFAHCISFMINLSFRHTSCTKQVKNVIRHKVDNNLQLKYIDNIYLYKNTNDQPEKTRLYAYMRDHLGYQYSVYV